jgi:hypothetical protein
VRSTHAHPLYPDGIRRRREQLRTETKVRAWVLVLAIVTTVIVLVTFGWRRTRNARTGSPAARRNES